MAERVLIVDDSASMRQAVGQTLRQAGYEVVEAVDGVDAWNKITPDVRLVITDLNMPNLDGIELIRYLRNTDAHRFTPILMLTTESEEAKKQAGRSAGATGWIVKPFQPDQLIGAIRKVLG